MTTYFLTEHESSQSDYKISCLKCETVERSCGHAGAGLRAVKSRTHFYKVSVLYETSEIFPCVLF